MSYTDVVGNARIFAASSQFQYVASGLQKLVEGGSLTEDEQQQFRWAGGLLALMDAGSPHKERHRLEDTTLATELTPHWYRVILATSQANLKNLQLTLNHIYDHLTEPEKRENPLTIEELKYAHQLFQGLANRTLDQCR